MAQEDFSRLLAASPERPRNCDLDGLAGWMRANPGVRIVTDVKYRPVEAHAMIAEHHPDLLAQFVPQAYQPEEIDQYRNFGYEDVIWTLYRYGDDATSVVREARNRTPSAITMPVSMADAGLLVAVREATAVPVYIHTVNDPGTVACLLAAGAAGIYSDDVGNTDAAALRDAPQNCPRKDGS
ncbi:hypothetical protein [Boseongicola aestuarii]|nr:hypothetical protein [Boseongicola aestuarii]